MPRRAMTLVEEVQAATAEELLRRSSDDSLRELREFYEQKQKEGAVIRRTYDLPPIDTIGRTAYRLK